MTVTTYFSPVAAFIALRETLEAGIIIAVLLGFVEQLIPHKLPRGENSSRTELLPNASGNEYSTFPASSPKRAPNIPPELLSPDVSAISLRDDSDVSDVSDDEDSRNPAVPRKKYDRDAIVRNLKTQVWTGALLGLGAASLVGAVFLYVFYTFAHDLWQDAENLWEGIFCGVAAFIILIMGLAFLRLPHARIKWRLKLLNAVEGSAGVRHQESHRRRKIRARAARGWILFGLPFITVLREGLEGVVFLGGIGITDSPHAVLFGALTGFGIGGILAYTFFAKTEGLTLQRFTTFSTIVLFLMGSGLASRSAFGLERQYFINGVGQAAAESGDGPGSYRVAGNLWKFTWGNPEPGHEGYSGIWQLAQSLVGWNNIGTMWTVGTYNAYWLFIILTLIKMKYNEGRAEVCGRRSERGWAIEKARRRVRREEGEEEGLLAGIDRNSEDLAGPSGSASGSTSRE